MMRRGSELSRRGRLVVSACLLVTCWLGTQSTNPKAAAQGGLLYAERFDNNANNWYMYSDISIGGIS